ncbi:MAG: hypothetical protein ACK5NG_07690 [Chthoniobacterales bacterium]
MKDKKSSKKEKKEKKEVVAMEVVQDPKDLKNADLCRITKIESYQELCEEHSLPLDAGVKFRDFWPHIRDYFPEIWPAEDEARLWVVGCAIAGLVYRLGGWDRLITDVRNVSGDLSEPEWQRVRPIAVRAYIAGGLAVSGISLSIERSRLLDRLPRAAEALAWREPEIDDDASDPLISWVRAHVWVEPSAYLTSSDLLESYQISMSLELGRDDGLSRHLKRAVGLAFEEDFTRRKIVYSKNLGRCRSRGKRGWVGLKLQPGGPK